MGNTKKKGNELVDLKIFRDNVEKISRNATQNAIEEKCGLPMGKLTRLYNGYDPLHVDDLIKISHAYNCSIDFLIGGGSQLKTNRKNLTAREACRMLAEIFDNFQFQFTVKEKALEDDWCMEIYRHEHNGAYIKKCSQVTMVLPANLMEYFYLDMETGNTENTNEITAALVEINNFIARYAALEKIEKMDKDMKRRLVQSYLLDVSEDTSPFISF